MLQFLRGIDQFGVQEKLQIPPIDPTQKSAVGGMTTLTLYTVSLAYFIYQLVDWQNNNKLPKYSSLKGKIDENDTIASQGVFAEIQFFQFMPLGSIDPFDPKNLIFQPVLQALPSDWKDIKIIDLDLVQTDKGDGTYINKFLINNIQLQGQPEFSNTLVKIDYQLQLQKCNQTQLDATQYVCANETTINKFEEQQNFFQMQLYIEQFDAKSKQLTKIPKQFIIDMRKGFMQYQVFQLQVNSLTLDDGFLFKNDKKINFLSDLQVTPLQYDEEYSIKYYGQYLSSILYFQIDTLKEKSTLEYPKISEILANTGSIVAFIMQLSLLVSKYNEHLCLAKANDYGQYNVIKNWKGEIKQVQRDGEVYKQKLIIDFFSRLDSVAVLKINYINLQLEVSKLQFLITNLLQIDQIKNNLQQSNNRQINHLIQKVNGCEDCQQGQQFINRIVPQSQSEDLQISNQRNEINAQILEQDIKNSIELLVLNQQDLNELEGINKPDCKGEIQEINLENNSIQ